MNFKTLALAGSLALSATFANASSILDDGSTSLNMGDSELFTFLVDSDGNAGDFTHTFTVDGAATGKMLVSILPGTAGQFTDLTLSWLNAADDSVLASVGFTPVVTELETIFTSPDTLSQKMQLSWTASATSGFDGEVHISVAAIPLPAGVLLLGTALGGLGLARRRKKAA